jgi:hypothetical protein
MDVHEGTATVREALRFSAYLRQPHDVSEVEKDAYVEEIIGMLELQPLADALIFSLNSEGECETAYSSTTTSQHYSERQPAKDSPSA